MPDIAVVTMANTMIMAKMKRLRKPKLSTGFRPGAAD